MVKTKNNVPIVTTKKRENTAQAIIEAVKTSSGLLTLAARKSGYSYMTVRRYVKDFPTVARAVEEAKEAILDFTESQLYKNIKDGDNASIIFYLKTQGKGRGYIERQELTGAEGRPIQVEAKFAVFDAKDVAGAIVEAIRLGLNPAVFGGNGHGEDASILPSSTDIQATAVPESEN